MKVFYGTQETRIDVTDICLSKLCYNNKIIIPCGDIKRSSYFTDPLFGIVKQIFIVNDKEEETSYHDIYTIYIDLLNNRVDALTEHDITNKLKDIQSKLTLNHGSFNQEVPEQKMAVRYLTGKEKVLEIGGNIGRNSLIIASLIKPKSLVTLECDETFASQLVENRDLNQLEFYVECSALSNRKLIIVD
jgi:hypothetical protein